MVPFFVPPKTGCRTRHLAGAQNSSESLRLSLSSSRRLADSGTGLGVQIPDRRSVWLQVFVWLCVFFVCLFRLVNDSRFVCLDDFSGQQFPSLQGTQQVHGFSSAHSISHSPPIPPASCKIAHLTVHSRLINPWSTSSGFINFEKFSPPLIWERSMNPGSTLVPQLSRSAPA